MIKTMEIRMTNEINASRGRAGAQQWLALEGKICVVSGAAGDIGSAIAQVLGNAGARLALLDRDDDKCLALASSLNANGVEALALACDIGDIDSVRGAVNGVESAFGVADVLVNNAGLLRPGGIEEIALEAWNAMLRVNLTGYMLCSQQFGHGSASLAHACDISTRAVLTSRAQSPRVGRGEARRGSGPPRTPLFA
jgi:NAD(P)-dependent dehydrogenase (short-subunit alcohol dehydrogenase family)